MVGEGLSLLLAGASIGIMVIIFILSILIGGFFLHIGSYFADIKNSTLSNAITAQLGAGITVIVLLAVFSLIPFIQTSITFSLMSLLVTFIVAISAIQVVYDTTFLKALIAWFVGGVISVIVVIAFAGSLITTFGFF
jgi:hypothetical protein